MDSTKHEKIIWDPRNYSKASSLAYKIKRKLYNYEYKGRNPPEGFIKVTKLYYADAKNETELTGRDSSFEMLPKEVSEDRIQWALKKIDELFEQSLSKEKRDQYSFIGLIRTLVIDDEMSLPREIFIKCLTMLAVIIQNHQEHYYSYLILEIDEEKVQYDIDYELNESLKRWLKKQLNNEYTSELFILLTRLEYENNKKYPSIEAYDKLYNLYK